MGRTVYLILKRPTFRPSKTGRASRPFFDVGVESTILSFTKPHSLLRVSVCGTADKNQDVSAVTQIDLSNVIKSQSY